MKILFDVNIHTFNPSQPIASALVVDHHPEHDPFSLSPSELRDLKPLATMVGGEWVYRELPG